MKWFKHDSNAHTDTKLKKVRQKYGLVGYGLYFYCLELIAGKIDAKNITFELEDDAETIALDWNHDQLKIEEMMRFFVDKKLFESEGATITCLKLAKRLDDTHARNPEIRSIINNLEQLKLIGDPPTNPESLGDPPENSEETPTLSEQIRLDKIKYIFVADDLRLAKLLFEEMLKNNPNSKPPNFDSWANEIRLMRERDNRDPGDIEKIILWCQSDEFWKSNILCVAKLRKQFDQLTIKSKEKNPGPDEEYF